MKFKVLFLSHAPDADKERHHCVIETELYQLFVQVVRHQEEALSVVRQLSREEGLHSILLCPGFTHKDVAEIQAAVKGQCGVFVARGDGPSSKITLSVMEKVGWFRQSKKGD
ncbi:MAG: hypothetical protein J7L26_05195 [Candidatus Aminicenantes bacterium]|nr:hypothetical protein [Candidatus Aminicenantes bacterium]